jgi:catechol 2,3-dioxygenase-like lactoylglutathione lyase family enzyme
MFPPRLLILGALTLAAASAQLAPSNELGLSLGHIHLLVKDVAAQQRFFTDVLGGTLVTNEKIQLIRFPGIYIMLRQGAPTAPPAGSIINHFGFVYKDLPAWIAKWKAAGVELEQGANPMQGYVHAPDGVRVEFFGDSSIQVPVKLDHVHFYPSDNYALQEWYAKIFNGKPGQRRRVATPGWTDCVFLPGGNFSFTQQEQTMAPTMGRALDHIGFEVTDLAAFVQRLKNMGIHLDQDITQSQNSSRLHTAYLTDPWGTRIELTQGLEPASR